jgi:hypothetical protein
MTSHLDKSITKVNKASDYMNKEDFDKIFDYANTAIGSKAFKDGSHSFAVVDKLYRQNIKQIDENLDNLQPILKPQASDLYYDRKVELTNLVQDKK